MSTIKKITREDLKKVVSQAIQMDTVPDETLFLAGITPAKEYKGKKQIMLEIVQKKNLRGQSRVNLLAALNTGDDRFIPDSTAYRVWVKITKEGFDSVLPEYPFKGQQLEDFVQTLKENEVGLVLAKPIKTMRVGGKDIAPAIVVRQYSQGTASGLPEKIQDILDKEEEERTEDEKAYLKSAKMVTKENEEIVDEYGYPVYQLTSLEAADVENIIIPNKGLAGKNKKKAKEVAEHTGADLAAMLAE